MGIFLDTNVVLNAALSRGCCADVLVRSGGNVFYVTQTILEECRKVMLDTGASLPVVDRASRQIEAYLKLYRVLLLPDLKLYKDVDTVIIYNAKQLGIELICTYNLKDFLGQGIQVSSPHPILFGQSNKLHQFQRPVLLSSGTVCLIAELSHPSSLGNLFVDADGRMACGNVHGRLTVTGRDTTCLTSAEIVAGKMSAFVFRYKGDQYWASQWIYENDPDSTPSELPLSSGKATFKLPITPKLMFCDDHNFSGYTVYVGGIPRCLESKKIKRVLQNMSMECEYGSISIEDLLNYGIYLL